jgi:hypothetical protein
VSEQRAREVVYERSGHVCEVCGHRRATEWHHRRNRSQGGPWEPSNGLHICNPCHRHITANPAEAFEEGWTVRSWEDWKTKPVKLWQGYCVLSDDGSWTNLGQEVPRLFHVAGCAFWTDELCDCQGVQ